jgi:methionine-rich copper-binding protein CopC
VTGTLHSDVDIANLGNDNIVVNRTTGRPVSNDIQYLLQVNVSDLDPAQNPVGTRWFLMGNLWIDGEQEVGQASRWVEITPIRNATTGNFTFLYPQGSTGQLNFRTIPGLVDPGLSVSTASTGTATGTPFSSITVIFDRATNPDTVTADQIGLTGPNGPVTGVTITPGDLSNTRYVLSFAPQTTLGVYTLDIGPNIDDSSGNPMQQVFETQFTVAGPYIIAQTPTGTSNLPNTVNHVRVTFNEPIDPSTFNLGTVFAHGPNGEIPITSVTAVDGSNNTQFDINFASQTKTGSYAVLVFPFIRDPFGNLMDQDQDFDGGQLPDDIYAAEFAISGSQVVSAAPNNTVAGVTHSLRVTFNEDIELSTFTPATITAFTDPNGVDLRSQINAIVQVSPTNFKQFDVLFTPQTTAGAYTMVIGPNVQDVYGNPMDQDADGVLPAESADAYTATFTIHGPQIVATTPASGSTVRPPVDHMRVTFNTPIQASSFTTDDVSLTDPNGNAVNITNINPVDFTNGTQFDIAFDPQTTFGAYTLTVSPNIVDTYGNRMESPYTATFTISSNLVTNGGFETGDFTAWTQSGDTGSTGVTGTFDGTAPHSGSFHAHFGPTGSLGFIAQTLSTIAGASYTLTFWLSHPYSDSTAGTEWLVRVGGTTLRDVQNAGNFGYTQFTFTFTATSSSTVLQFGFLEPPSYFFLDDVTVIAN